MNTQVANPLTLLQVTFVDGEQKEVARYTRWDPPLPRNRDEIRIDGKLYTVQRVTWLLNNGHPRADIGAVLIDLL